MDQSNWHIGGRAEKFSRIMRGSGAAGASMVTGCWDTGSDVGFMVSGVLVGGGAAKRPMVAMTTSNSSNVNLAAGRKARA